MKFAVPFVASTFAMTLTLAFVASDDAQAFSRKRTPAPRPTYTYVPPPNPTPTVTAVPTPTPTVTSTPTPAPTTPTTTAGILQGTGSELLGPATPVADRVTPAGVRYNTNGFDQPKASYINATYQGILSRGGTVAMAEEFANYARQMTDNPDQIAAWIDAAWNDTVSRWNSCGGTFAATASRLSPGSLRAIVRSSIMKACTNSNYCGNAAGAAHSSGTVEAVNAWQTGYDVGPIDAWLRKFPDLMQWEIGNWFGLQHGYRPTTVEGELGNKRPCEVISQ